MAFTFISVPMSETSASAPTAYEYGLLGRLENRRPQGGAATRRGKLAAGKPSDGRALGHRFFLAARAW